MPYNVYTSAGALHQIPDLTYDHTFYDPNANGTGKGVGIQLPGTMVTYYGPAIAQNFLQLMQNFAGPTNPSDSTSLIGQLWYNTEDGNMYVKKYNVPGAGINNWEILGSGVGSGVGRPSVGEILLAGDGVTTIGHMASGVPNNADPALYVTLKDGAGVMFTGAILAPSVPAATASSVGMTVTLTDAENNLIGYCFP